MLNNITFQLTKFEKSLAFQVIEQTEEFKKYILKLFHEMNMHVFPKFIEQKEENEKNRIPIFIISISNVDEEFRRTFKKEVGIIYYSDNSLYDLHKEYSAIIGTLVYWSKIVYELRGIKPQEPKQIGDRWVM